MVDTAADGASVLSCASGGVGDEPRAVDQRSTGPARSGFSPTSTEGSLNHASRSPRVENGADSPYALTSSSASVVAYLMNEVISSTARHASGLMSKLSWNMCIALSHT